MGKQNPVSIGGLWLDAHSGRIRVRVEIDDQWFGILDEPNDGGHISHIVEPIGIRDRAMRLGPWDSGEAQAMPKGPSGDAGQVGWMGDGGENGGGVGS